MFKLTNEECRISHMSTRTENHGDEHVGAVDLKLVCTMNNDALNMFDPELLSFLFKAKPAEEHDLVDAVDDEERLTDIRFHALPKTLAWDYKGAGYRLVIESGITGDRDIILINVGLKKFKITPSQGGSVEIEFTASANPNGDEVALLYELQQEYVDVTLEPPSAERQAQMMIDDARDEDEDDEAA